MSVIPWPDHLLSLEDWDALPEDNSHHVELVEGGLQVNARAASPHQIAMARLLTQLAVQLPAERFEAMTELEVVVVGEWPPTIRIPDLIVVPREVADHEQPRYDAADVTVVVEIVSPGSEKTDRRFKFIEYAEARIRYYWIVDLDQPVTLTAYELIDGEYEMIAEGSGSLELVSPAPLTLDLARLRPKHAKG